MSAACTAVGVGGTIAPPIEAIGRIDALVPSLRSSVLWFLAQLDGVSEAYHIPLGFALKRKRLTRMRLVRSLDALVARHESLRTTFYTIDGELYQRIGQRMKVLRLAERIWRDLRWQWMIVYQRRSTEASTSV